MTIRRPSSSFNKGKTIRRRKRVNVSRSDKKQKGHEINKDHITLPPELMAKLMRSLSEDKDDPFFINQSERYRSWRNRGRQERTLLTEYLMKAGDIQNPKERDITGKSTKWFKNKNEVITFIHDQLLLDTIDSTSMTEGDDIHPHNYFVYLFGREPTEEDYKDMYKRLSLFEQRRQDILDEEVERSIQLMEKYATDVEVNEWIHNPIHDTPNRYWENFSDKWDEIERKYEENLTEVKGGVIPNDKMENSSDHYLAWHRTLSQDKIARVEELELLIEEEDDEELVSTYYDELNDLYQESVINRANKIIKGEDEDLAWNSVVVRDERGNDVTVPYTSLIPKNDTMEITLQDETDPINIELFGGVETKLIPPDTVSKEFLEELPKWISALGEEERGTAEIVYRHSIPKGMELGAFDFVDTLRENKELADEIKGRVKGDLSYIDAILMGYNNQDIRSENDVFRIDHYPPAFQNLIDKKQEFIKTHSVRYEKISEKRSSLHAIEEDIRGIQSEIEDEENLFNPNYEKIIELENEKKQLERSAEVISEQINDLESGDHKSTRRIPDIVVEQLDKGHWVKPTSAKEKSVRELKNEREELIREIDSVEKVENEEVKKWNELYDEAVSMNNPDYLSRLIDEKPEAVKKNERLDKLEERLRNIDNKIDNKLSHRDYLKFVDTKPVLEAIQASTVLPTPDDVKNLDFYNDEWRERDRKEIEELKKKHAKASGGEKTSITYAIKRVESREEDYNEERRHDINKSLIKYYSGVLGYSMFGRDEIRLEKSNRPRYKGKSYIDSLTNAVWKTMDKSQKNGLQKSDVSVAILQGMLNVRNLPEDHPSREFIHNKAEKQAKANMPSELSRIEGLWREGKAGWTPTIDVKKQSDNIRQRYLEEAYEDFVSETFEDKDRDDFEYKDVYTTKKFGTVRPSSLKGYIEFLQEHGFELTRPQISGVGRVTNSQGSVGFVPILEEGDYGDNVVQHLRSVDRALTLSHLTRNAPASIREKVLMMLAEENNLVEKAKEKEMGKGMPRIISEEAYPFLGDREMEYLRADTTELRDKEGEVRLERFEIGDSKVFPEDFNVSRDQRHKIQKNMENWYNFWRFRNFSDDPRILNSPIKVVEGKKGVAGFTRSSSESQAFFFTKQGLENTDPDRYNHIITHELTHQLGRTDFLTTDHEEAGTDIETLIRTGKAVETGYTKEDEAIELSSILTMNNAVSLEHIQKYPMYYVPQLAWKSDLWKRAFLHQVTDPDKNGYKRVILERTDSEGNKIYDDPNTNASAVLAVNPSMIKFTEGEEGVTTRVHFDGETSMSETDINNIEEMLRMDKTIRDTDREVTEKQVGMTRSGTVEPIGGDLYADGDEDKKVIISKKKKK